MRRRNILGAAAALPIAAGLAAPAISQGRRRLRMVTDWPAGLPGLHASAVRLAETITTASGGRIEIETYAAGALVRPFETFDAVGAGVADMYHSAENYWGAKVPAFTFFASVPFGFTADELFAWVRHGGGQELWDELSGRFNIKPFLAASTACQMGGWFTREISSPQDFKGLRYRMPPPGGEVLRRLGASVVLLPGGDIVPALRSGALDASEFIGPWIDTAMGLDKAAGWYYYPAFHEPGSGLSLGINRGVWEGLDASDRRLVEAAAAAEYASSLAEFNAQNARSLAKLRDGGIVKIRKFDDAVLKELQRLSREVLAEIGAGDELSKKIYASYQSFRSVALAWSDVAERAFLNARGLS
jgi:TRAP-type mannitol/chloroaromatic compound transport system substrate-binding protein